MSTQMHPFIREYLRIAVDQIGVRERGGNNRGPEVEQYQASTGNGPGDPWCASFTFWCKQQAAKNLGLKNPFIRSAYTPDIYNWARTRDILIPCRDGSKTNKPVAGDDFLVMGPVRIYHTGIVRGAGTDTWQTIEGNSNSEGSNEGYEVASNARPYAARFYFVRWSLLLPEETPKTRALILGGKYTADLPVRENVTLCPVRKWASWMGGQRVDWVGGTDTPIHLNGKPLAAEITMIDGDSYVPIRDLVALDSTLKVEYAPSTDSVLVSRIK